MFYFIFFFKQKTAYEMRISDWSSDVCSSDLLPARVDPGPHRHAGVGAVGAELGAGDVGARLAQDLLARRDQGAYGEHVGHRAGRREPRGLVAEPACQDRKSVVEGKSVSVSVERGGRRIIIKKKNKVTI